MLETGMVGLRYPIITPMSKDLLLFRDYYPWGYWMGRARTKKLSKKEMDIWISGYNLGLKVGLTAVSKGIKMIRTENQVDKGDKKDISRKFK